MTGASGWLTSWQIALPLELLYGQLNGDLYDCVVRKQGHLNFLYLSSVRFTLSR